MNDNSEQILKPFVNLKREAVKIAEDAGFKVLSFNFAPEDEDGRPHVSLALEWDPNGPKKPEIVIIQAANAMDEAQQEAYNQQLAKDADAAREALREELGEFKRRGGFLDD